MVEVDEVENLEFKWGKKRGIGGRKKDVQFYESFTYDGLEYNLYDNVYLHKEGEPLPYLGKLIKIWENPDKSKKVKVLWFFQPFEISNFLVFELTHSNEVFLASGEGVGLANVNPLEAISGKCNIVCISKDSRNPKPSNEELQMADFVFYRTFDVGQYFISDKIGDKIAGIDVKFIFNQEGSGKPCSVCNLGIDNAHARENAMATNERDILCKLNSTDDQFLEDDEQEEQNPVVGEKLAANDRQENTFICKTTSPKVEENSDVKVRSVKPNFFPGEKPVSVVATESSELTNINDRQENTSGEKIDLSCNVKENADLKVSLVKQESTASEQIGRVGKSFVNQVKVDEKLKSTKDSGEVDERPQKKAKLDSTVKVSTDKNMNKDSSEVDEGPHKKAKLASAVKVCNDRNMNKDSGEVDERPHKKAKLASAVKVSSDKNTNNVLNPNHDFDGYNSKPSVLNFTASEDKSRRAIDTLGTTGNSSKKVKVDDKLTKPTNSKQSKECPAWPPKGGIKTGDKAVGVTRRPDSDRSKWFAELPWEERMQDAHEHGRLVLFQNLDPCCTSAEVEDIVWSVFKETCRAKMAQRTAYSSTHSAQALAIFKTSEVAEWVVTKLDEGCLLLPNRRPLVASMANPCFPRKQSTFVGHLILDKLKPQREMKEAVSTSHSSQPNTLEYDMAMEWCLLVERSDQFWKRLYKRQGEELEKLKAKFKSK
ncbi:protein ANTI-SILENCING 1 isoform X2 [Herrania umbratica]|uniref:Protein ANTI-SILENCING 1 isoform X2 n=1 Tax=Herrania umbratica TaxID=108875 RepID=A0A6J0ZNN5_9ROSI|nr:protein ANTI-SILENCING 1 isoform X2 [Herrania umbratica]